MTSMTTRAACFSASVVNTGSGTGTSAPLSMAEAPVITTGASVKPRRAAAPDSTCTLTFLSSELGASRMTCFRRIGESPRLASSMISWNLSCATMFKRSTAATPVRLP
ncbi:hypothetical protein D9M68_989400 [compost metagenome]